MKTKSAGNTDTHGFWKRMTSRAEFSVLIGLLVLIIGMSFASPVFMTFNNIFNVLSQISRYGIISVGMALIIITGGIDLSVRFSESPVSCSASA